MKAYFKIRYGKVDKIDKVKVTILAFWGSPTPQSKNSGYKYFIHSKKNKMPVKF